MVLTGDPSHILQKPAFFPLNAGREVSAPRGSAINSNALDPRLKKHLTHNCKNFRANNSDLKIAYAYECSRRNEMKDVTGHEWFLFFFFFLMVLSQLEAKETNKQIP